MRDPTSSADATVDLPDSNIFDYPSVGQIAQALRENDIIPIFAAQEDVSDFYDVSFRYTVQTLSINAHCECWQV